ncbi:MAG: hypothetical protein QF915_00400 [Candidatus Woesearchaeota archaeon]|jgi:hypothetical protein|nr:hypothetical protein [Candidatus Woesearchaeota archaeon]
MTVDIFVHYDFSKDIILKMGKEDEFNTYEADLIQVASQSDLAIELMDKDTQPLSASTPDSQRFETMRSWNPETHKLGIWGYIPQEECGRYRALITPYLDKEWRFHGSSIGECAEAAINQIMFLKYGYPSWETIGVDDMADDYEVYRIQKRLTKAGKYEESNIRYGHIRMPNDDVEVVRPHWFWRLFNHERKNGNRIYQLIDEKTTVYNFKKSPKIVVI